VKLLTADSSTLPPACPLGAQANVSNFCALQAVPLGMTTLASMARIARHYKGRFNTIVRPFSRPSPPACDKMRFCLLVRACRNWSKAKHAIVQPGLALWLAAVEDDTLI